MRRLIGFDTETHLIQPGQAFPRMVCLSYHDEAGGSGLVSRDDARAVVEAWLADPDVTLIAHNAAFDVGIFAAEWPDLLAPLWDAYEAGRIRCTEIRQRLLDVALGVFRWDEDDEGNAFKNTYHLADLVLRHFKEVLPKEDTWRLRYAELDGVPVDQWPPEARDYAIRDAVEARRVYMAQQESAWGERCTPTTKIPDEIPQTVSAWVLHLMAGWGIRTDGVRAKKLREFLSAENDLHLAELLKCLHCGAVQTEAQTPKQAAAPCPARPIVGGVAGPCERIMRLKKTKGATKPSRDSKLTMRRVRESFEARGEIVPLTAGGESGENRQPKTDEETLRATDDAPLIVLADSLQGAKLLSTYCPILDQGAQVPITSRPQALQDTGRTSWAKPNLQNPPRKGGVRECFVPRPGHVFCSVDYDTIELRAHAQNCLEILGWSDMADCLIAGEELHLALAASMLGISYADCVARYKDEDPQVLDARQSAKAANFGFPGGMGVKKFLITQRDLIPKGLTQREAEAWGHKLREAWMAKFRENRQYFNYINSIVQDGEEKRYVHPWSGRVRGGLDYCSAANGLFQGRTADGAKLAMRRWSRECYLGESLVKGARPLIFLHDEIFTEVPEAVAHEVAERKTKIMIDAMREVIPGVPITASAVLMRRWYKGAKPVRVDGRLVPCKPDTNGKWIADPGGENV